MTRTIEIDLDKNCRACKKAGALPNGLCFACAFDLGLRRLDQLRPKAKGLLNATVPGEAVDTKGE